MAEGIDAYAINLEFNLGGNAQKVIGDMVSSLTKIEQKLGDVAKQFSTMKFGDGASKSIGSATSQLDKFEDAVKEVNKKLSEINYSTQEQDLEKIRELQEKRLDLVNTLKTAEEAGVAAITKSELTQEAFNKAIDRGRAAQEDLNKIVEKLPKEQQESEDKMVNLSRLSRRIRKFEIESGLNMNEIVKKGHISKFKMYRMENAQIDKLIYLLEEQEIAARKAGEKAQADHLAKLREVAQKTDEIRTKWEKVKGDLSKVGNTISGIASKIGLGELAGAASAGGMYTLAIEKAAAQQERFHTLMFDGAKDAKNNIAYQKQLSQSVRDTVKSYALLQPEVEDAIISLRDVGATRDEILELSKYTAGLNRTTGTSQDITAKFAKSVRISGMSIKNTVKQLMMMQNAAREAGLAGKDLDSVMGEIGENSLYVGSYSKDAVDKYSKSLLGVAASAKKMGIDVGNAVRLTQSLLDPMKGVALFGDKMFADPATKFKILKEKSAEFQKALKEAATDDERWALRRVQSSNAFFGSMGADITSIDQMTKMWAESLDAADVEKKMGVVDPEKALKGGLKEATTLQREMADAVSKVSADLQNKLIPALDALQKTMAAFNQSVLAQSTASWGLFGSASINALLGVTSTLMRLWDVAKFVLPSIAGGLTSALSVAGRAAGSLAKVGARFLPSIAGGLTTAASAAGSFVAAAAPFAGVAAAIAATATAGWYAGKALEEYAFGFGDSTDRIMKGTATWTDNVKRSILSVIPIYGSFYNAAIEEAQIANTEMKKNASDISKMADKRIAAMSAEGKQRAKQLEQWGANHTQASIFAGDAKQELKFLERLAKGKGKGNVEIQNRIALLKEEKEANKSEKAEATAVKAEEVSTEYADYDAYIAKMKKEAVTMSAQFGAAEVAKSEQAVIPKEKVAKPEQAAIPKEKVAKSEQAAIPKEEEVAKPEPVVSTKITDETGRLKTLNNETVERLDGVHDDLKKMLTAKDVPSILKLLQNYLPLLETSPGSGLTSATNRWAV